MAGEILTGDWFGDWITGEILPGDWLTGALLTGAWLVGAWLTGDWLLVGLNPGCFQPPLRCHLDGSCPWQ